MAFEDVNVTSSIWKNNGLRYVLMPNAALVAQVRPAPAASGPPQPVSPRQTPPPAQTQAKPSSSYLRQQTASGPASRTIQISEPLRTKMPPPFRPLPQESWPQIWQDQFKNTKKGLFAWTYWNLGEDLLAGKGPLADPEKEAARAARGNIMRSLLHELAHPGGTHTFWPPWLDASAQARPILFWSGLRHLGCRGVIIFGSQAARFLIPRPGLKPLQQVRENGFQVWIMRDLTALAQNQDEYSRAAAFLQRMLRIFIHR